MHPKKVRLCASQGIAAMMLASSLVLLATATEPAPFVEPPEQPLAAAANGIADSSILSIGDVDGDDAPDSAVVARDEAIGDYHGAIHICAADGRTLRIITGRPRELFAIRVVAEDHAGATWRTLRITSRYIGGQFDAFEYDQVVSPFDGAKLADFRSAARRVRLGADVNGDGVVDGADLVAIGGALGRHDTDLDINHSGVVDGQDVVEAAAQVGRVLPPLSERGPQGGGRFTDDNKGGSGGSGGTDPDPGGGDPTDPPTDPQPPTICFPPFLCPPAPPVPPGTPNPEPQDPCNPSSALNLWVNNDNDDFDGRIDLEELLTGVLPAPGQAEVIGENDVYAAYLYSGTVPSNATAQHWNISYPADRLRVWFAEADGNLLANANPSVPSETHRQFDFSSSGQLYTLLPSGWRIDGPIPSRLLRIEAIAPSASEDDTTISVRHYVTWTPAGGASTETLVTRDRVMTVCELDVRRADGARPRSLSVGCWGADGTAANTLTGYDNSATPPTVINSPGDTFIERDPDAFRIRLTNPRWRGDPAVAGYISGGMITWGTQESYTALAPPADPAAAHTLVEKGLDTGVFESEMLLLCTWDEVLGGAGDDQYQVYSEFSGTTPVPDGQPFDRTRAVRIDGAVRVRLAYDVYTECPPAGSPPTLVPFDRSIHRPLNHALSLARPTRQVLFRVRVHDEPFHDTGFVPPGGGAVQGAGDGDFSFIDLPGGTNGIHDAGEPSEEYRDLSSFDISDPDTVPYLPGDHADTHDGWGPVASSTDIANEIARANISWECAGIRLVQVGPTLFGPAPRLYGDDILDNGWFDFTYSTSPLIGEDQLATIQSIPGATPVVLDVVFTGPVLWTRESTSEVERAFGWTSMPRSHPPLMAWAENTYVFMGAGNDPRYRTLAHEIGHCLINHGDAENPRYVLFRAFDTYEDDTVNLSRRMTPDTINTARLARPVGSLQATGNRLLSIP